MAIYHRNPCSPFIFPSSSIRLL